MPGNLEACPTYPNMRTHVKKKSTRNPYPTTIFAQLARPHRRPTSEQRPPSQPQRTAATPPQCLSRHAARDP
jgi:hypothetical protein